MIELDWPGNETGFRNDEHVLVGEKNRRKKRLGRVADSKCRIKSMASRKMP